jgi:hypothetical protein
MFDCSEASLLGWLRTFVNSFPNFRLLIRPGIMTGRSHEELADFDPQLLMNFGASIIFAASCWTGGYEAGAADETEGF